MVAIVDASGRPMRPIARVGRDSPAPYQAGGNSRRLRGFYAPGTGPTDAATGTAETLRNRSRAQYRNDPYGQAGINRLVSNIVGTGIKPRSMAESKEFQAAAQRLWSLWTQESDPEGQLSFYGQQVQSANTWLQAAECFVRIRPRRPSDGLSVPMQLQVMEPELCPLHYHGFNGANVIRSGIEFDPIGRRAAYWFYREHPRDAQWMRMNGSELVRVPAREVIHLYDPIRPGQIRGVVKMAPVLLRMHDVDKYDDATLLRQQIANMFAAFITRRSEEQVGDPENPFTGEDVEDAADDMPSLGMEPGTISELGEDEDIRFAEPPSAGDTYADFLRHQLMAVAAGLEVPYEVLTGDFSKINDRTARVLLNEFRRRVQQMQHHIVIHQLCRRVWNAWLPRAILSGALEAPGYADDPRAYDPVKWIPQAWAYIHPQQDVEAHKSARRSGFKTRAQIIAETTGEDIDDVDAQLAEENARADELGLVFDSDSRYTSGSGVTSARPEGTEFPEPEEEGNA